MLIQPLFRKSTLVLALGLLLGTAMPTVRVIAQPLTGTIISVGDGDTIRVRTAAQTLTVRLACIDAPEMSTASLWSGVSQSIKTTFASGAARIIKRGRYRPLWSHCCEDLQRQSLSQS